MTNKQKIPMMDYEACQKWALEERLMDRRDKMNSETRRYSLHDSINDGAETWKLNCEKWRRKGEKVTPFALSLEELNSLGDERYELIDLSNLPEDFRKNFRSVEIEGRRVYYTKLFQSDKCKAYLGAINADALIHYERRRFSSSGIPVKKINSS